MGRKATLRESDTCLDGTVEKMTKLVYFAFERGELDHGEHQPDAPLVPAPPSEDLLSNDENEGGWAREACN